MSSITGSGPPDGNNWAYLAARLALTATGGRGGAITPPGVGVRQDGAYAAGHVSRVQGAAYFEARFGGSRGRVQGASGHFSLADGIGRGEHKSLHTLELIASCNKWQPFEH